MRKSTIRLATLIGCALVLAVSLARTSSAALLAHWKLDAGSGQTVADFAGSNNGTLGANSGSAADDPTWTTSAKIGTHALSFDGSDWVNFGDVLDLGSSDFTVSIWMQANGSLGTTTATSGRLLQKRGTGVPGSVAGWQLATQRIDGGTFRVDNSVWEDGAGNTGSRVGWISSTVSANDAPAAGLTMSLNQWHNLTAVFNNTNDLWLLYVDGVLAQSVTVSNTLGSVNNGRVLSLGAGSDDGTAGLQFFSGLLDDPGIFSGALGESYARAIYSLGNNTTLNYDLSLVDDLFGVFEEQTTEATIGGLTWTRTTGLATPLGVVTEIDGAFYLALDGAGNGITTFQPVPIPEPSSLVCLAGLLLAATQRRKKQVCKSRRSAMPLMGA